MHLRVHIQKIVLKQTIGGVRKRETYTEKERVCGVRVYTHKREESQENKTRREEERNKNRTRRGCYGYVVIYPFSISLSL